MSALYLCRPGGDVVGLLSGLEEASVKLKRQITPFWELTFEVYRYDLNNTANPTETTYYHSLSDGMELLLESDEFSAFFKITEEPTINNDGVREMKMVIASSIESELQDKMLRNFKVNTGLPESLENLVQGNLKEEKVDLTDTTQTLYNYNFNPYTNLPIDYITVVDKHSEKLQSEYLFTPIYIYWNKYDVRIPYTITDNEIIPNDSSQRDILFECINSFITDFPRIQQDIRWVIDDDNLTKQVSSADDKIVCVVEKYLYTAIVNDVKRIYISQSKYNFTLQNDGWHISKATPIMGGLRLQNGITRMTDFYNKFGEQLSLLDLALESAKISGWSVGDVPDEIANKYFNFTVDNQDIYSFFTNNCANSMKVIFDFDRLNKKVNIVNVSEDDVEHDTGVIIGFNNLINSIDINSSSEDGIKTKFNVSGGNDLGILYANFGSNSIIDLDYFMSKIDQYGNRQFVSDELYNKYQAWKAFRDSDPYQVVDLPVYKINPRTKEITNNTTTILSGTRREVYQQLSEYYNQSIIDRDTVINLLPNDGVRTDYMTYNYEDLKTVWRAYNDAFYALIELYKEDYNAVDVYPSKPWLELDQRVELEDVYGKDKNGNDVIPITDTMYCHDFAGYYYNIIPNVLTALKRYIKTNENMQILNVNDEVIDIISPEGDKDWVYLEGGNPYYNSDEDKVEHLSLEAYKYDMSLYGRDELQVLKKSWIGAATQIFKDEFRKSGSTIDDYIYNTWADLTDEQKEKFQGQSDYEEKLNSYLDYTSRTVRYNKLVTEGTYGKANVDEKSVNCKGIIFMAQDEIDKCETLLTALKTYEDDYYDERKFIADSVTLEQWLGGFTDKELGVINSLIFEADFKNENILITNLDALGRSQQGEDTVTKVQNELLKDAEKKLVEKSRPQYAFTANMDNILALPEFSSFRSSIQVLNYIYMKIGLYDNETVRLRIISIENNPLIPTEEMTIEFSNMLYTYDGISDLIHLFEDIAGTSSSNGTSGSSSGGTYGTNDAQITLSNNMLNALLKNRDFISYTNGNILETQQIITERLNAGAIVVGGYATDGELENGLEVTSETLTSRFTEAITEESNRAQGAEETISGTVESLSGDLETLDGEVHTTSEQVSELSLTVNGLSTTVGEHTTSIGILNTEVQTAQSTAESASTAANNAQGTANTALSDAATAQSTANTANSTANTALTNAATAQNTADGIATNLSTNYWTSSTTESAIEQSASQISQTVSQTYETKTDATLKINSLKNNEIKNAQDTADAAQGTANTALTNAGTAQSTATAAQNTANTALNNAATAQGTADGIATNLADNYYTRSQTYTRDETNSAINTAIGSIDFSVYETTEHATTSYNTLNDKFDGYYTRDESDANLKLTSTSIVSSVSSSIAKWDESNLNYAIDGYYIDDASICAIPSLNNKYILCQADGKVYKMILGSQKADGSYNYTLQFKEQLNTIQSATDSKITQTSNEIRLTVGAGTEWVLPNSVSSIDVYEFEVPDNTVYPPSTYNNKYYLDKTTGYIYKSNGSSWSKVAEATSLANDVNNNYTKKASIIATINSSGETGVKISADKVEIDGTAIFNAISSDVDSAIDTKTEGLASEDDAVASVVTSEEYGLSTSTLVSPSSWSTSIPTWESGKYIWKRIKTVKTTVSGQSSTAYQPSSNGEYDSNLTNALSTATSADGKATNAATAAATAQTAANGAASSVVTTKQYYLSTSDTETTGGTWVDYIPSWSSNKKIWTRYKTVITTVDGTELSPEYTPENGEYDVELTTSLVYANGARNMASDLNNNATFKIQSIYISKPSGTSTSDITLPTRWITENGDLQNTWTIKRPTYNSSYPILFIATQKKTPSGSTSSYDLMIDDTTTIIDGGHITTGTIQSHNGNTWLNLDNNSFHYGGTGGFLDWNNLSADTLYISGKLRTADDLTIDNIGIAGQACPSNYYSFDQNMEFNTYSNYNILLYPNYMIINFNFLGRIKGASDETEEETDTPGIIFGLTNVAPFKFINQSFFPIYLAYNYTTDVHFSGVEKVYYGSVEDNTYLMVSNIEKWKSGEDYEPWERFGYCGNILIPIQQK